MAYDYLALLLDGVILVRENPGESVAEGRRRLGEAHLVFVQIGLGFALVPFECQWHRVLLQRTRGEPVQALSAENWDCVHVRLCGDTANVYVEGDLAQYHAP